MSAPAMNADHLRKLELKAPGVARSFRLPLAGREFVLSVWKEPSDPFAGDLGDPAEGPTDAELLRLLWAMVARSLGPPRDDPAEVWNRLCGMVNAASPGAELVPWEKLSPRQRDQAAAALEPGRRVGCRR